MVVLRNFVASFSDTFLLMTTDLGSTLDKPAIKYDI